MPSREEIAQLLYSAPPRHLPERREPIKRIESEDIDLAPPEARPRAVFPLAALPRTVADYCVEVALSYEVEPEIVILPALASLSAAIGNSRRIRLKSGPQGWTESAMLWIAIVATSGSLKSPALAAATKPLSDRERDWAEEHERDVQDYEKKLAAFQACKDGTVEKPPEPVSRRAVVDDPTMEELIYILRDNPRGLALIQDELVAWVAGMNQYKAGGKGADRAKWLKFWGGFATSVDRRAEHGRPVRVWRPFIAVAGGIQPSVLRDLQPEKDRQDGFMERILYGWPGERIRKWTSRTVNEITDEAYDRIFDRLLQLQMGRDIETGRVFPLLMDLTSEAYEAWVELYDEHHLEMASPDLDSRVRGAYAKLDGYAARLALVIQLTREAAGETEGEYIDVQSVISGWAIADYFKAGIQRVFEQMQETGEDATVADFVSWARKREMQQVTLREAMMARRPGFKTKTSGEAVFKAAEERGYGKSQELAIVDGAKKSIIFRFAEGVIPTQPKEFAQE